MELLVDTHVHIYPRYDVGALFDAAFSNFNALGATTDSVKVLMLTERWDCAAFDRFVIDPQAAGRGFSIETTAEPDALIVRREGGGELMLIAGRQVATAERLEVLLLGKRVDVPDRLSIRETIRVGSEQGAVPVLNWSLGKWWNSRGAEISALLEEFSPQQLLLGDVLLRPRGFPEPKQFLRGGGRGFRIVAGSDPLPFAGEEGVVGGYVTRLTGASDRDRPASSLRALLQRSDTGLHAVGSRGSWTAAGRRLLQNELARRR